MKPAASAAPAAEQPLVELDDVWVRFDSRWVLKGIQLACWPGEILGIVGPNGGGKSTLLRVILGLVAPQRGRVKLFGGRPDKRHRSQVGYLPQISHAEGSFPVTTLDVVLMGLYNRLGWLRRPGRPEKERALKLLADVDMQAHADTAYGILSGGQQQRVNIARALASEPRLLVLDEPSTGIDSVAQEDFYELLARLRNTQRLSVIMVSHDIGMVSAHADRAACLNREIHYHGEPESCFTDEFQRKLYGNDLRLMVHDSRCATCSKRHADDP